MTTAVLASISGPELSQEEVKLLEKLQPVGVSLFGRNIINRQQVRQLTSNIKDILGQNAIVAVDQEGGRVRRMGEPEWRSYASQYVLGQLPLDITRAHAILIAEDLHEAGINFNYAPVLDMAHDYTHEVLKSRCFSSCISEHGKVMIDTYCRNGICPCIKHIPGHGGAQNDPHLGLPTVEKLLQEDLQPFIDNSKAPAAMTAHIVIPEIDEKPITMSSKAIKNIIRGQIGFNGLLISDAIEMRALQGSIAERAENALAAGCDIVCYCGGKMSELSELLELNPKLSLMAQSRLKPIYDIIERSVCESVQYADYAAMVGTIEAYKEIYDATEVLNQIKASK